MGDCCRRGIRRDFATVDGEDDKVVAVRGALRAGSARICICRADCESGAGVEVVSGATRASDAAAAMTSSSVTEAVGTRNFWLILLGSTSAIGAIGAVIQHFILFLKDQGYSATVASRFSTGLLAASLAGRILVGYAVDHVR